MNPDARVRSRSVSTAQAPGAWRRFAIAVESRLRNRRDGEVDASDWVRMLPLSWTALAVAAVAAVVGLVAHLQTRGNLALAAMLVAIGAATLIARTRGVAEPSRLLTRALLLLTGAGAVVLDVAAGGTGFGALVSLPFVVWLAVLLLPRAEALVWLAVACVMMTAGTYAANVLGHSAALVPLLIASLGLGVLVGSRLAVARAALRADVRAELDEAVVVELAAWRERERFDAFAALPGSWYWETDADLQLQYIAPGLATFLGLVDGVVIGRTLVELVQRGRPNANGTYALSQAMESRLDFAEQHLIWIDDQGRPVALQLRGVMAYTAGGLFRGYRGTAREVPFASVMPQRKRQRMGRLSSPNVA